MKFSHQFARWSVVAGLALGTVAAIAQDGYVVDTRQESLIKPGMTKAEVQQVIGRPSREQTYGVAAGSTYVYGVRNKILEGIETNTRNVFEVDFGTDGRVISAGERVLPSTGGGGSGGY